MLVLPRAGGPLADRYHRLCPEKVRKQTSTLPAITQANRPALAFALGGKNAPFPKVSGQTSPPSLQRMHYVFCTTYWCRLAEAHPLKQLFRACWRGQMQTDLHSRLQSLAPQHPGVG